jgi:CheY-like chemotaxis protein
MKVTPLPHANILLIDDNKDGLVVRRSVLEELGYRVEISPDAEDALKMAAASRFDVIVTDYKMPTMTGIELIGRVRQIDPNVRVILLSGFVDPLGLTEENTGADSVVVKSSREPVHLVRAVKRLLNRPARKPPGTQSARKSVRTGTRGNLAH